MERAGRGRAAKAAPPTRRPPDAWLERHQAKFLQNNNRKQGDFGGMRESGVGVRVVTKSWLNPTFRTTPLHPTRTSTVTAFCFLWLSTRFKNRSWVANMLPQPRHRTKQGEMERNSGQNRHPSVVGAALPWRGGVSSCSVSFPKPHRLGPINCSLCRDPAGAAWVSHAPGRATN